MDISPITSSELLRFTSRERVRIDWPVIWRSFSLVSSMPRWWSPLPYYSGFSLSYIRHPCDYLLAGVQFRFDFCDSSSRKLVYNNKNGLGLCYQRSSSAVCDENIKPNAVVKVFLLWERKEIWCLRIFFFTNFFFLFSSEGVNTELFLSIYKEDMKIAEPLVQQLRVSHKPDFRDT